MSNNTKICPFKINWVEKENTYFNERTHIEEFGKCDESKCPFYEKESKFMYCNRQS